MERDLLGRGDPASVLRSIQSGDPLGLQAMVVRELESEGYLIDVARAWEKACSCVAALAGELEDDAELEPWLRARVRDAVRTLLEVDRSQTLRGEMGDGWDDRYAFLIHLFGIEPGRTRAACVAYNALPRECRATFCALVLHRRSLADCIESGLGTRQELVGRIRRAFEALYGSPPLPAKDDEQPTESED